MLVLVRIRSLLARHPSVYWGIVAVAVAIVASSAWSATQRVEVARRSWGDTQSVWVAERDIAAGEPLVAVMRTLPIAAVPADAVIEAPDHRSAVQHIGAGEIVTNADVGGGLLDALPTGWRAVAVVTDPARVPVDAGDHVAVYADGLVLADDGIVLDVADGTVTVAVPAEAAAAVSVAARNQTAVLAIRRP